VIQEVVRRSRMVTEGQLFAKYPHIPRDTTEQRRKTKNGEMQSRPLAAVIPLGEGRRLDDVC
jgi:hypothetical protein